MVGRDIACIIIVRATPKGPLGAMLYKIIYDIFQAICHAVNVLKSEAFQCRRDLFINVVVSGKKRPFHNLVDTVLDIKRVENAIFHTMYIFLVILHAIDKQDIST